ncbi:type VI secretion system tube protein TssD [Fibrella sp. WM1]|uniref:type VI secretion system tube protein TssD n=1 Tax=Fibrella musci TaxID=3242485 RepID=UPI0035210689
MASFTAFLEVGGNSYPLYRYEFSVHQETDTLGRPSSPVLGGTITCTLSPPSSSDSFLYQWMMSPNLQQDGKIRLLQAQAKATEKTISFFNAYCTSMDLSFMPGLHGRGGSSLIQLQINPQRVAIGAIVHDNNWPLDSHGAGESFAQKQAERPTAPPKKEEEPSTFMEGLHGVLDVVGMIPVIGEVADLANAAIYASEGRYGEAALSAASAIPVAGNFVGAAKLGRRALKVADKLGDASKLVGKGINKAEHALDAVKGPLKNKRTKCGDPVDVASGEVLTDLVDFSIDGPIPLIWERVWYSSSSYAGPLGYGWHHSYDWAIIALAEDGTVGVRDGQGRLITFDTPTPGGKGTQTENLALFLSASGVYRLWHMGELRWYTFGPVQYGQDHPQPLLTIEDPNGYAIRFAYNDSYQLKTITDCAGRVIRVDHDTNGHIIALYSPQTDDLASFELVCYEYDDLGNLAAACDAEGARTLYVHSGHQLIRRCDPSGFNWHFDYEATELSSRCIHTWGDDGLLDYILQYDSAGQTTVLNSYRQPTVYMHQHGLVTRQINALGQEQAWLYDDSDQLISERNALGEVTRYVYDLQGRLVERMTPSGHVTRTQYDERGLVAQVTDPRGGVWFWTYDQRGNVLERGNPLGHVVKYAYDQQGHLETLTDALGQQTNFRYNAQGNLAHIITPDEQIRSFSYDNLGRLVQLIDPTGAKEHRSYDRTGQLVRVEEVDGTVRELVYDSSGNVIEAREHDQVAYFAYTALGQVTSRRQDDQQVQFVYDREGRLTDVINQGGLRYRFALDATGQVIEEEGFDGLLRRYERDAAGRVSRVLRPGERTTTYSYTEDGQLASAYHSDGSYEIFAYDEAGSLIKAQNAASTVRIERDVLGNIRRESQGNQWIEYAYNAVGQRTQLRSSLGASIDLQRDSSGNVTELEADGWKAQFRYDGRGLEVQRRLSGQVLIGWQHDVAGQPIKQQLEVGDNALRQRIYRWQAGRLLSYVEDSLLGASQYTYDAYGALMQARYADGSTELRSTDLLANFYETETHTDRHFSEGGQLLSTEQATFSYDAEGNLTHKTTTQGQTWTYQWADNGSLTDVARPDGQRVSFLYDALNRRISKSYQDKTTYWLWDGNVPIHEWVEYNSAPFQSNDVITWLFEENSFSPIGKLTGDARYSILTDHLGTPLEMIAQSGQSTWQAETTSYGRVRLSKGTRAECPFRFQGQYEDVETELYYNRFRYYAPQEGVYISQDPIGLLGDSDNLYAYVDNPLGFIDPLGLATVPPGGHRTGDVSDHGTLSPGTNRAPGHTNTRPDRYVQSHHPIQDEWAQRWAANNGITDYRRNNAPATLLESSSGTPHARISAAQRARRRLPGGWDTTLRDEFRTSYREMLNAGVPGCQSKKAIKKAYKYFDSLGGFDI